MSYLQGLQCSSQQAEHVTSRGGHIVWLGRDIRNQSPQCTVCTGDTPTAASINVPHLLAGRAVPHVYTLALFREALRCAAGGSAVVTATAEVEVETARVEKGADCEEDADPDPARDSIYHVESCDPFLLNASLESGVTMAPQAQSHQQGAAVDCDTCTVDGTGAGSEKAAAVHAAAGSVPAAAAPSATSVGAGGPQIPSESLQGGVVVSIDMGALAGAVRGCGYITGSSNSATGLTVDEILDIVMIAGADPRVRTYVIFILSHFDFLFYVCCHLFVLIL